MKFLALLVLTFSVTAFAQSTKLVHVLDGSTARCETMIDTFQYANGAYKLSSPELSIVNEALKLTLTADFYTCGEFDGVVGFKKIGFFESYSKYIYSDVAGLEAIEINTESAVINYVQDGAYNLIGSSAISDSNAKVSVSIPLTSILSQEQMDAIKFGETVETSVDAFLAKVIHVKTSSQDYKAPVFYGTFRTHFSVNSEKGVIKAIKR